MFHVFEESKYGLEKSCFWKEEKKSMQWLLSGSAAVGLGHLPSPRGPHAYDQGHPCLDRLENWPGRVQDGAFKTDTTKICKCSRAIGVPLGGFTQEEAS